MTELLTHPLPVWTLFAGLLFLLAIVVIVIARTDAPDKTSPDYFSERRPPKP